MKRLDILVCEQLNVSREYAKEIILSGRCALAGKVILKPGAKFPAGLPIEISAEKLPYVSRGGLKLAHALDKFNIKLSGLKCLDIGASTGGFTDCMLQRGASIVVALDNGHGQLDEKLRQNHRVIPMERANIMDVTPGHLPFAPHFAAVDLSFISLLRVIPKVSCILVPGCKAVFLLKPQFECGPKAINKKGVVKSLSVHIGAVERVFSALVNYGFHIHNMDFSPITGQNGNTEYLIFVERM